MRIHFIFLVRYNCCFWMNESQRHFPAAVFDIDYHYFHKKLGNFMFAHNLPRGGMWLLGNLSKRKFRATTHVNINVEQSQFYWVLRLRSLCHCTIGTAATVVLKINRLRRHARHLFSTLSMESWLSVRTTFFTLSPRRISLCTAAIIVISFLIAIRLA